MLRCHPELAEVALVAGWARLGRPVIVRRRVAGDASGVIPAALPLPPSHGKRRLAFSFPPDAAVTPLPPVSLRAAAAAAPNAWRDVIWRLVGLGESAGVPAHVFGALLWQHVSGLAYLTDTSDLDLLWPVPGAAAAELLIRALIRLDEASPVRLDGELVLPDGAGVSWRELAQVEGPSATVLVKTMNGVQMRRQDELFCREASS